MLPHTRGAFRRLRTLLVTVGIVAAGGAVGFEPFAADVASASIADDDWLGIVNAYRSMSGLDPVTPNATWSAEGAAHSCYMLQNGISHDEVPGNPGYTPGGDVAGNSGNVAVSSAITANARDHIDLWMTGPFHAIGILRHNLTESGFGLCAQNDTPTVWRSGGTLDVIRGLDHGMPRPATPILFPGDGATVSLTRFITEFPDPMAMCNWTGTAGLPLIAMMPNDISTATATLTGPNGPIDTCVLHETNVTDGTARSILRGDNAVVVMPRDVLADGAYTASVTTDNGSVTWSFNTNASAPLTATPDAPPEPPDTPDTEPASTEARFDAVAPFRLVDSREGLGTTRLRADTVTRIAVAGADVGAISANFVAVSPSANGFLTAYNCTDERPTVSTLNYRTGSVVSNQAIVPLDGGDVCVYSKADTDLVIDLNGYYRTDEPGDGFVAVTPQRLLDTRETGRLRAGRETRIDVGESVGGAPDGANAVALNVAAIQAARAGWLKIYPCDAGASNEISSLNYGPGEIRPNAAVVPVVDGELCMLSLRDVDVTIDLTGYFGAESGEDFLPLTPIRLFDSRSIFEELNAFTNGNRLRAGEILRIPVAGERGIPEDAIAVSVTLAATEPAESTFVTAFPCGVRPETANVNVSPIQNTTANGAMTKLSPEGELCIYTRRSVHVVLDINGIWR